MPQPGDFQALIEYRYGDRGGIKGLCQIFNAKLPYETRVQNAVAQYRISTRTAARYHAQLKKLGMVRA